MTARNSKRKEMGRSRLRVEDHRLVTGRGRFVADIALSAPLHVAFVRSPYARASINRVEIDAALAAPAVRAVFTGEDVAALGHLAVNRLVENMRCPRFPVLARDTVHAVGEPLAAVLAETPEAAMDATELVEADLEPMEAILGQDAGRGRELFAEIPENEGLSQRWNAGDPDQAFESAAHIVTVDIAHPRVCPFALEPRAAAADWDDGAGLTIWLPTQAPHRARSELARILGIEESRLRVIAPDVGGAFGMKAAIYPEDVLVAWAARELRRPVKWIAGRGEEFLSATHGRGMSVHGEMALSAEGEALGLRARLDAPLGHWMTYSAAAPARNAGRILPGPYRVPAVAIDARGYLENTAAVGIYRGAGRPEAAVLMEQLMDQAARHMGFDPVEIRRRNLVPSESLPWRTPTGETLDSGNFQAVLDAACDAAQYHQLRQDQARRREVGEICGIGVAFFVEPSGRGHESARLTLERDGTVTAATGSTSQGQGRETAFAQILSDALFLPTDAIHVVHGDTSLTPAGIGAVASRSTPLGGSALLLAAGKLCDNAASEAAELLAVEPEDVKLEATGFRSASGPGALTWSDLAARAGPLEVEATFDTEAEAWGNGCAVAAVAIDGETGVLDVERIVWVDDIGRIVNPDLVEGQLCGGIAQGLGEALMERIVYDEDGQLLTGSLMDYALPRAGDMPPLTFVRLETPAPTNPLGAKGVGEAGTIGAPAAILNAVLDALAPFGIGHLDMPLTSESIWRALHDTREENR